jgi:trigger factor
MKSEIEKLTGLTRKLNIEIAPETVKAALDKMYRDVQRVAKFKGFRPGKAPIDMVKTQYKSKVESDVATRIIEDHYGKAIEEHSLQPVNYPEIEFDGLSEGQPLKFSAVFEVRPDVQLKKYEGLEIKKKESTLDFNPQVEKVLADLQKNRSTFAPLEEKRAAAMGDVAVIDFHGLVDGKDLAGGSGQEQNLELGSKSFIDGFEEGIVGMMPDESRVLNLKFPDEYHSAEIAGKPVEFKVTLKEIKKKILPVLDDEFAKTVSSHQTISALKEEILKDVKEREEKLQKDEVRNMLLQSLVDANHFEVPKSMVAEQKKAIIDDVHHRMENEGMTHDQFEEYKSKWDKDFEKSAEFVIRSSLLIGAIAKKENLTANEGDFENKLSDYSKQSNIEIEKIRAFYSKPENRSRMTFQITEERVVDFLLSKAKSK